MKQDLLQRYFGFKEFRSGQERAVRHILAGHNTLVIMPTGAGKSLIYQYSALALAERRKCRVAEAAGQLGQSVSLTLVLSPLLALMKDQVDNLHARGIAATYINSTLSGAEQRQRSSAMLQGHYDLVYVTPERLRQSSFVEALKNVEINLLVIDEAHCISSWGHDFRPDYRRIAGARKELGEPLTVALTATATTLVQDDIIQILGIPAAQRVVTGFNRPNLSFEVFYASGARAKLQELALLLQEQFAVTSARPVQRGTVHGSAGACIVYVATRKETEEVATFIGQNLQLPCACYHAGMAVSQREQIQDDFSAGKLGIVVATNAFGMGIDRADVRLVLHYSLPATLEAYYQEAGRAGRDGRPARAVLLYSPQDRSLQNFFICQNSIDANNLYTLYQHLQEYAIDQKPESIREAVSLVCRLQDLSQRLGWNAQKLRLALSHLEKAGILRHAELAMSGIEDGTLHLQLSPWHEARAAASIQQLEKYKSHRKSQLEQMTHYAQTDSCRRQILLAYFSDHSGNVELSASVCCDYCFRQGLRHNYDASEALAEPNLLSQLNRPQRAALIVLDSIRQLEVAGISVGRRRIAQLLSGSASQKMTENLRQQRYYGRLAAIAQKQIEGAIDELLRGGYLQYQSRESSEFTVIVLSEEGEKALKQRRIIELKSFRKVVHDTKASHSTMVRSNSRLHNGRSTTALTLELLEQGVSIGQVAKERGLSRQTVSSHVGSLIEQGKLNVDDYVDLEHRQIVEKLLQQLPDNGRSGLQRLRPIKELLPPKISYDDLKFVLGAWKRIHGAKH